VVSFDAALSTPHSLLSTLYFLSPSFWIVSR